VTARGHAAFSTSRVSMPKMRCSSTTLLRRSLSFQLACCRDVYPNIQARLPSAAPTMHRIDRTRRELNAYAKPFRTARFASEFHPPKSALGQTIRKKRRSTPAPWNHLRQRGTRIGAVSGVTVGRDGQFICFRAEETTAPWAYFGFCCVSADSTPRFGCVSGRLISRSHKAD
jgi:hypothetical protein